MVEVFKTNVTNPQQADELTGLLRNLLPGSSVNFDLEDCDRILRIEGEDIAAEQVVKLLKTFNCECDVLL